MIIDVFDGHAICGKALLKLVGESLRYMHTITVLNYDVRENHKRRKNTKANLVEQAN